jgi:hypothetical protein
MRTRGELTVVNLLQGYLSIMGKGLLRLSAQHESLWDLLSGHCGILRIHSAGATGSDWAERRRLCVSMQTSRGRDAKSNTQRG